MGGTRFETRPANSQNMLVSKLKVFFSSKNVVAKITLAIYFLLLIFPSTNYILFSGLPLNSPLELTLLFLIIPVLISKGLRSHHTLSLANVGRWSTRLLLIGGLLALGVKVLLISTNTYEGFLACYRPLVEPLYGEECERSYENPLYQFGVTRIDSELNFLERDWNLSFFNALRFNFNPEVEGSIARDRIPFEVNWSGEIESDQSRVIMVTYVGEGSLTIGQRTMVLPARYNEPARESFDIPQGLQTLAIAYRFDDGYRIGSDIIPGPHAIFKIVWVEEVEGSQTSSPFTTVKAPLWGRGLGLVVDVVLSLYSLSLLITYLVVLRPFWLPLGTIALAGIGAYAWTDLPALSSSRIFVILVWCVLAYLVIEVREREQDQVRLLFVYFALFSLAFMRILLDFGHLDVVVTRPAGQDWLTYEGQARTILETGSLEGGEAIFYYQPFFRYIKFAEHILFGDSDVLIACIALGALNFAIFFMYLRFHGGRAKPLWKATISTIPITLILLLVNAEPTIEFIQRGASEYPTWIFLPLIFALLFGELSPGEWLVGTLLLGFSLIVRVNQLPALVVLFLIYFFSIYQYKPKWAMKSAIIMIAISLLPLAHNLFYGGKGFLFTSSTRTSANLALPPSELTSVFSDSTVRASTVRQLRAMFYLRDDEPKVPALTIAFHGLQLMWGAAIVLALVTWRKITWKGKALLLIPLLYIGVHLFYQVTVYYPRHIIAGHMAMGLVAYWISSSVSLRD